jgi:5'(3')-deoxyribonucleotidase
MDGKIIVYVDMDGVLVEFPETIDDVDESIREQCREWCAEKSEHHSDFEGIFSTLKPMEDAISVIDELSTKFEIYLLSTAPWNNTSSWSDKRRWVEKYLPNMERKHLILTHRKDLNRGAFLIDDRPNNGAREFDEIDGQVWIHFGSERFPDWKSVMGFLQQDELTP